MKKIDKIDSFKKLKKYVNSHLNTYNAAGKLAGLCDIIEHTDIILTYEQKIYLFNTIPPHGPYEYVWKANTKSPRIKWINEQLNKLEMK